MADGDDRAGNRKRKSPSDVDNFEFKESDDGEIKDTIDEVKWKIEGPGVDLQQNGSWGQWYPFRPPNQQQINPQSLAKETNAEIH
ncbi:hypothetical protein L1987_00311 [Smallanthus sonchifolius]|uniref:Uncharacterized protein n=1 Tax=Smallanthus sonchifolius TaxID=185202 RepID=A0ACB9K1W5_9ASTR|nr:hypothetical protein L1987_00311 [Smallanthus sonchifolius]